MKMVLADERNKKVMVAMDVDSREQALLIARQLQGGGCWLKVGLELFCHYGEGIVRDFQALGFPIFLDLKLHDIPNTVERTVKILGALGVEIINVHAGGGYEMMARAADAARQIGENTGKELKVIGVTVLTSLTEGQLQAETGVARGLQEQVTSLAQLAQKAGLDGVVASAREVTVLRQTLGEEFLLVTPGIRPPSAEHQDQARVSTPLQALADGSSFLVVGRPITQAENPRQALEALWG
ncbi:MAG: orotidine-5'-phosphate decarboxylase [Peptococcaceae bacterium]|jgi:orotidine-5'-phosphate decarboxylase|nr:orotidine-5'-phosphate decarboxylase [Peptococcaceae bacterium]